MNKCKQILEEHNITHRYIEGHMPVTDYETSHIVDQQYNLTGMESKCMLLKTKSGKFAILITTEGKRLNNKGLKAALHEKATLASSEELMEQGGYIVGCAAPFGYPKDVTVLVDNDIFNHELYICSAGLETESFEMVTEELKRLYEELGLTVIYGDDFTK